MGVFILLISALCAESPKCLWVILVLFSEKQRHLQFLIALHVVSLVDWIWFLVAHIIFIPFTGQNFSVFVGQDLWICKC